MSTTELGRLTATEVRDQAAGYGLDAPDAEWLEFEADAFLFAIIACRYNVGPNVGQIHRGKGRPLIGVCPITREGDEDVKWIANAIVMEWNGVKNVNGIEVQRNYNPFDRGRSQRRFLYQAPLESLKNCRFSFVGRVVEIRDGV